MKARKLLALLITCAMCASLTPTGVLAAEETSAEIEAVEAEETVQAEEAQQESELSDITEQDEEGAPLEEQPEVTDSSTGSDLETTDEAEPEPDDALSDISNRILEDGEALALEPDGAENIQAITLDESYELPKEPEGEYAYFSFAPTETGYYTFEVPEDYAKPSSPKEEEILLCDENLEILQHGNGSQFTYELTAGVTYVFGVPITVWAGGRPITLRAVPLSGTTEDGFTWKWEDGTLTISGAGALEGYDYTWSALSDHITKVVIGEGITYVNHVGWGKTQEIELPSSLEVIGTAAFLGCSQLKNIFIPEGVKIIEYYAFSDCTQLTQVSLPSSLRIIRGFAFSEAPLEAVSYAGTRDQLDAVQIDGYNQNLLLALGYEDLTSGRCGENAYWSLDHDVLTIMGTGETYDYSDPPYAPMPPWSEFCDAIETIIIEDGITTIGSGLFFGCENVADISIPRSVTKIGDSAFSFCGMKRIVIPDSVVMIGDYAFDGCYNLEEILFLGDAPAFAFEQPWKDYEKNSSEVFHGVTATVYYPGNNSTWTEDIMLDYGGSITWVQRMENIQAITLDESFELPKEPEGEYAYFSFVPEETRYYMLQVPAPLVGGAPLLLCDENKVVLRHISPNRFSYELSAGVTYLFGVPIRNLPGGTRQITLVASPLSGTTEDGFAWKWEDGVLTISGTGAMTDYEYTPWRGLSEYTTEIVIETGITYITYITEEFGIYPKVQEIKLPSSLEEIGKGAFMGCTELKNIVIPEGVKTIGESAFAGCEQLTQVSLPSSLRIIRGSAFSGAPLEEVSYTGTRDQLNAVQICGYNQNLLLALGYEDLTSGRCGKEAFWSLEDGVLTITGTGETYDYEESPTPWAEFSHLIETIIIEEGITSIGISLFYGCDNATSISIPRSITKIGVGAFVFCGMKRIVIPDSVEMIGAYAFNICDKLEEIVFWGDAPAFAFEQPWKDYEKNSSEVFHGVTATAYYPGNNPTWTEDIMLDYGGSITWVQRMESRVITTELPAEISEDLLSKVSIEENEKIEAYDVELQVSSDDGISWSDLTDENFPKGGVDVTLPYPAGTDESMRFKVYHMFTSGDNAGKIEILDPVCTDDGLVVTVYSLSPFAVSWKRTAPISGDINGDGTVDLADLIRLMKYLTHQIDYVPGDADVNGDGAANAADLLRLMRYVNGELAAL